MTSRRDLEALIARLEKATEGSEELNIAILETVFNCEQRPYNSRPRTRTMWWYERGTDRVIAHDKKYIKNFTRSVDGALSLVPEGWAIAEVKDGLRSDAGRYCSVRLWCPNNPALGYRYPGNGATIALALCIAALRARLAEMEG